MDKFFSNTDTTLGDLKITSSYKLYESPWHYKKMFQTGEVYKKRSKKGQPKTRKELFTDGVRQCIRLGLYNSIITVRFVKNKIM